MSSIEAVIVDEGMAVVGWRDVPVNPDTLGKSARAVMPTFKQLFVTDRPENVRGIDLDRRVYIARKRIEHELPPEQSTYFPSLSARTLIYKGMLTTPQLAEFFPDLNDERMESAVALVHSRFSTNTFPSWPLAHPYRFIAHNGEINTVQGNRNWMRAREALLKSDKFRGLDRAFPICTPGASDSASFDEVLELLHLSGRSLPHAMLMMIPEAWENNTIMDPAKRAFYRFHSSLMEPWDGPASVAFTDGTVIGSVLDRNGLRPGRYWVTDDDIVVMASETGVIEIDQSKIVQKGRMQPGRMFLVDTAQGRIISDEEIKASLAAEHPYAQWLEMGLVELPDLPDREHIVFSHTSVLRRQQVFGYTHEELKIIVAPTAKTGAEPIGSMGTDTPLAVLSKRPRLLFDYFQQLFAQVTNPPLDAIREEVVTAVSSTVGPEHNLLAPGPESCRQLVLPFPIIDNDELAKIIHINDDGGYPDLKAVTISGLFRVSGGGLAMKRALDAIRSEVSKAIDDGARIIVLSDRNGDDVLAPIPSLLLTAAVHHHLVREKKRTQVGLVIECGDAREVHHMALLIGYGAGAINPYLAFESIEDMIAEDLHGLGGMDPHKAVKNYIKASGKGVLKVMSKMGVSTVASYTGAQIFEAIGLGKDLVEEYFTGTVSRLGGIGLDEIAAEVVARHAAAHPTRPEERAHRKLELGGEYQWRREGEIHLFNPDTVFKLQHATRAKRYDIFKQYTKLVDDQSRNLATLRGMFRFSSSRASVPLEDVEPISEILKRFSTGAMSYGSISAEAHETLAIAMNSIGAKSNTGEGGEDSDRLLDPSRRSAIKQVASGRFGVTSEYLVNADDLQIKMAQGAKPGEGGQLPGHKVYPWIAKARHSTPGVGLISPPPHHDIYSIEDLKQLIHDLKNANPKARVHVKLVAEMGVGTVAAGVSKAKADVVLISGHDGGTGASPLTSLKHAGGPWELGLAETQQTLLLNGLRDRIVVQTDGQLKTGRDVVVAALLGAEEFGFATAPLVVSGCVMMRVCHLDTCPVGVATQNPELRKRFSGKPEFVVNFFEFIAEEVRELMAGLGFRTMAEMIGHVEALDTREAIDHWKAAGLDISPILAEPINAYGSTLLHSVGQDHGLDVALDQTLIEQSRIALDGEGPVSFEVPVHNVNRTVGTMLGNAVTTRYGGAGLPDGSISVHLRGSAGQSFGAFVPAGIELRLEGDANDYVAKGLSGGRIIVHPDRTATFAAEQNVIAGNVIGYGATSGEIFLRGTVGERFCVRNSGATAVVEGVGDHGCEYMTGGRVIVLGPTGRNFAAGMSGGIAYVHDPNGTFADLVNYELVELEPMDALDAQFVGDLVRRHGALTGSPVAQRILADWDRSVGEFRKVMPRDYKRVLTVIEQAASDGLDEDATSALVMASIGGQ
jgi:glutamate synthase (NADPH/NADH) large chain